MEDGGWSWSWIRMQLRDDTHPTNLQALKEEITRLWVLKMADSQVLHNMLESMPDRLQEVIQKGGNTTKY
jgi:ABC-type transport system involved in cytochrome bd biosynthesis fused ATPase/permease subunit